LDLRGLVGGRARRERELLKVGFESARFERRCHRDNARINQRLAPNAGVYIEGARGVEVQIPFADINECWVLFFAVRTSMARHGGNGY
jgi:hypothetical protein